MWRLQTQHEIWRDASVLLRFIRIYSSTNAFLPVMEYLGGGEIKWRTQSDHPLLRVDQTRRICRDVILGLEYRMCRSLHSVANSSQRL